MSSTAPAYEPDCPECGWVLPEHWRLDHDRSRWECRHCRRTFGVHEMDDQIKALLTDPDINESNTDVVLSAVTETEQFDLPLEDD